MSHLYFQTIDVRLPLTLARMSPHSNFSVCCQVTSHCNMYVIPFQFQSSCQDPWHFFMILSDSPIIVDTICVQVIRYIWWGERFMTPVPLAMQSKAHMVFDCSNTRTVDLNPTRGMDVCLHFSVLWCPVQIEALWWADPPIQGVICIAGHVAEFVKLYTKAFMFLWNILFENDFPFKEPSNFIHNYMYRWTVKFRVGVTELIEEHSHFPNSVTVIVIFVWLVHTSTKM
jgi:hypothetical protein